jgi:type IX secretion system PorP/SprF family membrane protein
MQANSKKIWKGDTLFIKLHLIFENTEWRIKYFIVPHPCLNILNRMILQKQLNCLTGLITKALIISVLLLTGSREALAQYHPQYSQYMFTGLALNPAYAGSEEVLNLAVMHRSSRWGQAVKEAPVTQSLSGDFPLQNPQLALGMMVMNDRIAIYRQTGVYAAYAFRVQAGTGKLSLGVQAGFDMLHEDAADVLLVEPDDPLFAAALNRAWMPNAGVGAYYYTQKYFVSLSLPHLLSYRPGTGSSYRGRLAPASAMLYGGLTMTAGERLRVRPSALLQYAGSGFLFDLNCNVLLLDNLLELGVSLRSTQTLVAMAQIKIQSLRIGYAYDHALGIPGTINTSHEILLRYDLKYMVNAVSPLNMK